jgi:hypothetical protein
MIQWWNENQMMRFRSDDCLLLAEAAFESVSEVRGSSAKHARREGDAKNKRQQ